MTITTATAVGGGIGGLVLEDFQVWRYDSGRYRGTVFEDGAVVKRQELSWR